MAGTLQFPKASQQVIIETAMMRRAANRTLAVVGGGGMAAWFGRARLGKSITANWLTAEINRRFDTTDPDTFRAIHYEVGGMPKTGGTMKSGIRSIYHACAGRLDQATYLQLPAEALAGQLVHGLRRKHIRLIFVDEAGCLSLEAIRGMVLLRDVAELEHHPLSIVFVGMDDLPAKLCELPQIELRLHEWVYFEPYNLDETWALLAELHPFFAGLDGRKREHQEMVSFIHETFGGVIGEIVPYLRKVDHRLRELGGEPDLTLLRAVHLSTQRDKTRAIQDARLRYKGKLPDGTTAGSVQPQKPAKGRLRVQKGDDAA
ncbi:MAG TPA: ATP-binding protein [Pyrinomonadaceae bacterium]